MAANNPTVYKETPDRWAIGLSFLCLLHCLFTPVILVLFPAYEALHDESAFHEITFFGLLAVASWAFYRGYRLHRKPLVLALASVGFALLLVGLFIHEWALTVTSVGSVFLIAAHLWNMKYCRCHCCED